jgi:hypothetical protein
MAEWLAHMLATQVAWVRSSVLANPTISVKKLALFCNPAPGGTFSSTAIEIINWLKFSVAKANVSLALVHVWNTACQRSQ